ncbi:TetR/AcrR family transcriptional regulator [Phenylobacterium sp. LjRoot219]|uniref:TetR/AcrR family transcriptional regulator n=1 Tax=Phenylobacterium sp. LjRoot219 TaxID=3342283 RepID=UPI003ECCC704
MNLAVSRKDETRRRIVETAARLFMEKGVDRVGVDEIMRECGLTHGGFYSYFPSKEALISDACVAALEETAHQWEGLARKLGDDEQWASFLDTYLAGDLVTSENNPACPAAILGADVARRPGKIQDTYVAHLRAVIDKVGEEAGSDRAHAILSFAALVGATSLAAQVGQDKDLAAEILNTTRDELLKCRPAPQRTKV